LGFGFTAAAGLAVMWLMWSRRKQKQETAEFEASNYGGGVTEHILGPTGETRDGVKDE
jgi:hypothetical protein